MKVFDVSLVALTKALEVSEEDLATATNRIADLEAENALLNEYHAACERFFAQYEVDAFTHEGTYAAVVRARVALRQYEPETQP